MKEIFWAGIALTVMAAIAIWLLISDKRRHSLFPDDGIVWNTQIEKRLRQQTQEPEGK